MKWATHADMQAVRSLRPNVKGSIEVSIPLLLGLLQSVLIFALLSLCASVRGVLLFENYCDRVCGCYCEASNRQSKHTKH